MREGSAVTATIQSSVSRHIDALITLANRIHAEPELGFEETKASLGVADVLAARGFTVEHGAWGLDTAVDARYGDGPTTVVLCAEYDALPGVGHACGHNLIAAMSVGAGLALAEVADEVGLTVRVVGTPAEEGGGGKILMLERGAFDGADLALMAHPGPTDVAMAAPLAVAHVRVAFEGRAAHAASFPELGLNAADAMTVAQVAVGLLRQQLPTSAMVHGIVTKGGDAPNVIPARVEGRWYVRADTIAELSVLEERVKACFTAGALATGCRLEWEHESHPYSEFRNHTAAVAAYRRRAEELGRRFDDHAFGVAQARASTDMGNVSLVVPAIHPHIGIETRGAVNHHPDFAASCTGPSADLAVHDGAALLALTALDLFELS